MSDTENKDLSAMLGGSDISVDIAGTDYDTLAMIAEDLGFASFSHSS